MVEQAFYRIEYSQCRQASFAKAARNRVHRHSYYEPGIVIFGSGEFEHEAEVYPLQEGDLFLANPDSYHEIRSLRSQNLSVYFLGFYVTRHARHGRLPQQAQLIQSSLERFLSRHQVHLPGQAHLTSLFEHAMKLARQQTQPLNNDFYSEASLLLINQIITALTGDATNRVDYSEQAHRNRVVEYIEKSLHKTLRVAQIARACGMSERNLRRKWRNWSPRSLSDEIKLRRVERACQLLLLPDISIAEVGEQVGIDDPAQFSRLFKKVKQQSPRLYRQTHLDNIQTAVSENRPFRTEFLET